MGESMFNIVLCDDNVQFLNLLREMIRKECALLMSDEEDCIVGPALGSGEEVLTYIKKNQIDVLFLDIDMPRLNGFELAKILCKEYKQTLIVFMSAFDNFVYDSFEYFPFAYMRKERIAQELPKVLKRIVDKITEPERNIVLCTTAGDKLVDTNDILYFESDRNYYIAHLVHGKSYACRGTLSEIEDQMKALDFFRIHSAFLINLEHVERISENGFVLLKNITLPIAQRRLKDFKKVYMEFTRRCFGS